MQTLGHFDWLLGCCYPVAKLFWVVVRACFWDGCQGNYAVTRLLLEHWVTHKWMTHHLSISMGFFHPFYWLPRKIKSQTYSNNTALLNKTHNLRYVTCWSLILRVRGLFKSLTPSMSNSNRALANITNQKKMNQTKLRNKDLQYEQRERETESDPILWDRSSRFGNLSSSLSALRHDRI